MVKLTEKRKEAIVAMNLIDSDILNDVDIIRGIGGNKRVLSLDKIIDFILELESNGVIKFKEDE